MTFTFKGIEGQEPEEIKNQSIQDTFIPPKPGQEREQQVYNPYTGVQQVESQQQQQQQQPQVQTNQPQGGQFTFKGIEGEEEQPEQPPEKGIETLNRYANKAGRLGTQYGMGLLDAAQFANPVGAIAGGAGIAYNLIDEDKDYKMPLPKLLQKGKKAAKEAGFNPEYLTLSGLLRGGIKNTTGIDLEPKDVSETAANWMGFIKNPVKALDFVRNGVNPKNAKEIIKAFAPTAKQLGRGLGAATGLKIAADAELGPMGKMIALVGGDLLGGGAVSLGKGAYEFGKAPIKSTKEGLANLAAKKVGKTAALDAQKQIIKEFREAGIQPDIGTITGDNFVKWFQNAVSQSGHAGKALDKFKNNLTKEVVGEYKKVANTIGKSIYASKYEAGQALKTGIQEARNVDYAAAGDLFKGARSKAANSQLGTSNPALMSLGDSIKSLEKELLPGSVKSSEQTIVLRELNSLKKDIFDAEGNVRPTFVKDLINNKIGLSDVINYEAQGGAKKLLKHIVKKVDEAISSNKDPIFNTLWKRANSKFTKHAQTFRNKSINSVLRGEDATSIFNKMNSPSQIVAMKKALGTSKAGKKIFDQVSRYKMEEMVGKNMVDSTTKQMKYGTFSKLLEKGQNREIAKQLLKPKDFSRLERLMKVTNRIAETQQKFFNASKSGTHLADIAFASKALNDFSHLISGNPWPFVKTATLFGTIRGGAKLLSDPEFLKMVEEAILKRNASNEVIGKLSQRITKRVKQIAGENRGVGALKEGTKE